MEGKMIADVRVKNGYYEFLDERGKKIKEISVSSGWELCGHGSDFVVFNKNGYYVIVDDDGSKLEEMSESSCGDFKKANGDIILFEKNSYVKSCDKNGRKIAEWHAWLKNVPQYLS